MMEGCSWVTALQLVSAILGAVSAVAAALFAYISAKAARIAAEASRDTADAAKSSLDLSNRVWMDVSPSAESIVISVENRPNDAGEWLIRDGNGADFRWRFANVGDRSVLSPRVQLNFKFQDQPPYWFGATPRIQSGETAGWDVFMHHGPMGFIFNNSGRPTTIALPVASSCELPAPLGVGGPRTSSDLIMPSGLWNGIIASALGHSPFVKGHAGYPTDRKGMSKIAPLGLDVILGVLDVKLFGFGQDGEQYECQRAFILRLSEQSAWLPDGTAVRGPSPEALEFHQDGENIPQWCHWSKVEFTVSLEETPRPELRA